MGENRTLAAILNLLLWGAGYFYRGEKTLFGTIMLGAYILDHVPIYYLGLNWFFAFPGIFYPIAHTLVSIALAYDAYKG